MISSLENKTTDKIKTFSCGAYMVLVVEGACLTYNNRLCSFTNKYRTFKDLLIFL